MSFRITSLFWLLTLGALSPASAQDPYLDPGVSATEIKIGQTAPFSGPVSSMAVTSLAAAAYFKMINDQGGVNGRKINLVALDDAYSPAKAIEAMRTLVESENVFLVFAPFGTATNIAYQRYLNAKHVPSLFIASAASRWDDSSAYPWTTAWSPSYSAEASLYAKYVLQQAPNAKIAVLRQNDDFGADYVAGFKKALGDAAGRMIVKEVSYDPGEPTIDSQILQLRQTNADVLMIFATPKATVQALRKTAELDWTPLRFITHTSHSVASVMKVAGFEHVQGTLSAAYQKDPDMAQFKDDPEVRAWSAWMDKYEPEMSKHDFLAVYSYNTAQALVEVLKSCGDDLTREHVRQVVRHLDFGLPMLLPGIKVQTSPDDPRPIKQMQMLKFEGEGWRTLGEVTALGR